MERGNQWVGGAATPEGPLDIALTVPTDVQVAHCLYVCARIRDLEEGGFLSACPQQP